MKNKILTSLLFIIIYSLSFNKFNLNKLRKDLRGIKFLMKKKKICHSLQLKVKNYLDFINEEKIKDSFTEKSEIILKSLPLNMQLEIIEDSYSKILNNLKIFKNNFSEKFIKHITHCFVEKKYFPGENIFLVTIFI